MTHDLKSARPLIFLLVAFLAAMLFSPKIASAQNRLPSTCLAVAEFNAPLPILKAGFSNPNHTLAQSSAPTVNIRYATHSTFRIESPEGIIIATDYNGRAGTGRLPDIVTMNHAHGTHWTAYPQNEIGNVLRGWGDGEKPASHYLELADRLTRNVTTDIMRGGVLVEQNGNSIFIFEIAGLCIGHVGHLHHTLTTEHVAAIGRLDILMVPVDGGLTLSINGISDIARQFRSSVILPMHWFSDYSLQRFLQNVSTSFAIDVRNESDMDISLVNLPASPTVIVLQPELGGGFDLGDR